MGEIKKGDRVRVYGWDNNGGLWTGDTARVASEDGSFDTVLVDPENPDVSPPGVSVHVKQCRKLKTKKASEFTCYRDHVNRTAGTRDQESSLTMGAMGLAGEAGEVCDLIKKVIFHKKTLDREKLKLECGDVRYYFELLLIATGLTMEEVEQANVEKLQKRYPNGFTIEDAARKRDENG